MAASHEQTLNVAAILASPRLNGNSRVLLDRAMETLRHKQPAHLDIQELLISRLDIAPCRACEDCFDDGRCRQRDDMDRVQSILENADLLVVASPVYFSGPPGPFKQLIDRCQNIWAAKTLLRRQNPRRAHRRALILLAAARKTPRVFEATQAIIRAWLRSLDVPAEQVVTCPGVDGPGEASARKGRLEAVERAMAKILDDVMEASGLQP